MLLAAAALLVYLPASIAGAVRPRATYAGTTTAALYPPPNAPVDSTLFPDESQLGYAGPTPTGDEAFAVQTAPAYPYNNNFLPLIEPGTYGKKAPVSKPNTSPVAGFNPLRYFGNLSPWYSTSFGLDEASPLIPDQCALTQVHFLFRHGARYPTTGAAPAQFAEKVNAAAANGTFAATGVLDFLNTWTFKLGAEILTPFGRKQMFDLGINQRSSYGALLKNFTEAGKLPVFRTESEDRMVKSVLNWAAGFFGIPYEDQFQLELVVETPGFNNSGAPYDTCVNSNNAYGNQGGVLAQQWQNVYLKDALKRFTPLVKGINLTINDAATMLNLCAYETVALGYSAFCPLFTEEEFRGFEYAFDISFWYNNGPGSPVAAAQGASWSQEFLNRLKNVQFSATGGNPFSVNLTLDSNNATFPLGQSIYADATHEVIVLDILTALNFSSLAKTGPPPLTHIPHDRSFIASQLAPFGTNLVAQVLDCSDIGPAIRFFLNDGALPIGIDGCKPNKDGLCPLKTFTAGLQKRLDSINWAHDCLGNYTLTTIITDGRAPLH